MADTDAASFVNCSVSAVVASAEEVKRSKSANIYLLLNCIMPRLPPLLRL